MSPRTPPTPSSAHYEGLDAQNAKVLELTVLSQMRDSLTLLNNKMEKVSDNQQEMKADLATLKGQDATGKASELAKELDNYKVLMDGRMRALELSIARYQGLFVPFAILGSAMLSGGAAMFLTHIMK